MSISRVLLITLLISSAIVALALLNLDSGTPEADLTDETTQESTEKRKGESESLANSKPTTPVASAQGTPDGVIDDAKLERQQIAEATKKLASGLETDRIEGVEALGAYPNPDTEATLSKVLATDPSADVRNAAALSLGALEAPSAGTLSTLLTAIKDPSDDVRFSALSTLEDLMLGQDEEAPIAKTIRAGLETLIQSPGIPDDLKDSIREVLHNQRNGIPPGTEPSAR
jgi:hypothetical protein